MPEPPAARRLLPAEAGPAADLLVEVFADDPTLRWVWPADTRWRRAGRAYLADLLDRRLRGGEVWCVLEGGQLLALALWEPPGGLYVEPAQNPYRAVCTPQELARLDRMDAVWEGAVPPTPHWYLGILGVAEAARGRGLARAVLHPVLAAADRVGLAVVLETGAARNVTIYHRLGFGEIAVRPVDEADPQAPTLTVMERLPRPSGEADAGPVGGGS